MPKFKSGDRVRILEGHPYHRISSSGTVRGRAGELRRGKWEVDVDGYVPQLSFKSRELELLLKLEAGKFYKLANGETAGPAEARDGYFLIDHYHYRADGRCAYRGGPDINEDWRRQYDVMSEAQAPVAATADQPGRVATEQTIRVSWGSPAPTTDFIIARMVDGQPRPSQRPFVHDTLESATAEARRLANLHGDEFAVYQRIATESIDAGPVPGLFYPANAQAALEGKHAHLSAAFIWDATPWGADFWEQQHDNGLTTKGRAILKKWLAQSSQAEQVAA